MTSRTTLIVAAMTLAAAPLAAQDAAEPIEQVAVADLPLSANPRLEGVSAAFLQGAFDAPGVFVAASTMGAGSVFPAHSHPDARVTYVTEGVMYLGTGEAMEEAMLVAYPAGTAAVTPAGTVHWMAAREGAFSVLEIGAGPSETAFVE